MKVSRYLFDLVKHWFNSQDLSLILTSHLVHKVPQLFNWAGRSSNWSRWWLGSSACAASSAAAGCSALALWLQHLVKMFEGAVHLCLQGVALLLDLCAFSVQTFQGLL